MGAEVVRFNRDLNLDFVSELKKRVDSHFTDNNISKFGNTNMKIKTVFMVALYFVPLTLLLTGFANSFGVMMILWSLMGLGMVGIGTSVMHDANHGAYSNKSTINKALGYLMNTIGSYHLTWKIQHNVLHHTSTNVHDYDEDLNSGVMRFSPNQKKRFIFKFQAFYAPFLYGLLTINKIIIKDLTQVFEFSARNLLAGQNYTLTKALIHIFLIKSIYILVTLVLPIIILDFPAWQIIIGFLTMHYICGFLLAMIFQSAHVLEETEFFNADENGSIDNCWAIHQLRTTANFGRKSKMLTWLVGGLNHQVEHHLFPNICHVHYSDISPIVKQTAKDFGIEYLEFKSFFSAIGSHFRMMHKLGQAA
ncbi:MAG: acyl-CoA desaturase [Reichenbachiella sp.]